MPHWVPNSVFYQIFPDRFAFSNRLPKPTNLEPWDEKPTLHGFKGGDLHGAASKLNYLADLGFNAIYLCPIFASTANHRYHTHDYYQVDPILGGNAGFRHFLDTAHELGIKVIIDGVFNHASRGFLQFNHTLENGSASPYLDWFHFNESILTELKVGSLAYEPPRMVREAPHQEGGFARFGYRAWWDLPALPKFNFGCHAVRQYFLGVAKFWIDFGVDGWRLDVPEEIEDPSFWQDFRRVVKGSNPDAYIVGEIWDKALEWVSGERFDAVMNYFLGKKIISYFLRNDLDNEVISESGFRHLQRSNCEQFRADIEQVMAVYPHEVLRLQLNLLTSHDTPRLLTMAGGNLTAAMMAQAFLLLFPGAPCIYYGEEIGMEGRHDPDCRRGFPLNEAGGASPMADWLRHLIDIRMDLAPLATGEFRWLGCKDDQLLFERATAHERVLVAMNCGTLRWTPQDQRLANGLYIRAAEPRDVDSFDADAMEPMSIIIAPQAG